MLDTPCHAATAFRHYRLLGDGEVKTGYGFPILAQLVSVDANNYMSDPPESSSDLLLAVLPASLPAAFYT
jgi:hypothetical protein